MIQGETAFGPEKNIEHNKYQCDPIIVAWLAKLFEGSPDSIKHTIEEYFNNLELREDLLINKAVLDVGSEWAMFDRYAEKKYNSTVASISLDEKWFGDKHQLGAIADARALPFKDEAFDLVISHASMPHFLIRTDNNKLDKSETQAEEARRKIMKDIFAVFEEAIRVTKPGGQIRMSTLGNDSLRTGKNGEYFDTQKLEKVLLIKDCIREIELHMNVQITFKDAQGLIIIRKPKEITINNDSQL